MRQLIVSGTWLVVTWSAPVEASVIEGRVVDASGEPVAAAEIRIWRKTKAVAGGDETRPISAAGATTWKTDGDGRFQTPDIADLGAALRVIAQADGLLAARSGWIPCGDKTEVDAGTIVLRRLRTIAGRVVDRRGAAVAGAIVFNSGDGPRRVETSSDAAGAFRLAEVPEGQVCLFVEHPSYRFSGAVVHVNERVELVVSNAGDQIEPIRTLPRAIPASEAGELGRRVAEVYLEADAQAPDFVRIMALYALSNLDPLAAIERMESIPFANPEKRDETREQIILGAIREHGFDDWTELRALIESSPSTRLRAACLIDAARHVFADDAARRRQLVHEALLHAQGIDEAGQRALALARISLTLSDLGQRDEAEALARKALAVVDPLPVAHDVPWNITGTVAEALARFDLPAARAFVDRLHYASIYAFERGRLACDAATRDAALAERLWIESGSRPAGGEDALHWRNIELGAPICYRIARLDPAVAMRVAEGMDDNQARTTALAAVAQALAESDADAARRLAHETLARQPKVGATGPRWSSPQNDAAALCQWLPTLERIDPQLWREFLWRAVALRPPTIVDRLDDEPDTAHFQLIGLVAHYDRTLAEALLAPWTARFEESSKVSGAYLLIASAALIDPRAAESLVDRLPAAPAGQTNLPYDVARLMWLSVLSPRDDVRWAVAGYRDPSHYETW